MLYLKSHCHAKGDLGFFLCYLLGVLHIEVYIFNRSISEFSILFHVTFSLPILHNLCYYNCNNALTLDIMIPPTLFFFFKIVFYFSSFAFYFLNNCRWYFIFNFCFLISIANIWKYTWFFILILCPETKLNSLISSKRVFVCVCVVFFFKIFGIFYIDNCSICK